jgi:hypothetical protein
MFPPKRGGYIEEIFQKMYEYQGFDVIRYIEFHYDAFEDKEDFVRFLRYETIRELRKLRSYWWAFWIRFTRIKVRLKMTLEWAEEMGKKLRQPGVLLPKEAPAADTEQLLAEVGKEISTLMHTHAGKIVFYNQHHATKLIQLLILLRDTQVTGKKGVMLFKSFSDTDMAAILRQFEGFGDKKTNTLQVRVGQAKNELNLNDPAVQKLIKALAEFFFS